jgi:hypothetical protein
MSESQTTVHWGYQVYKRYQCRQVRIQKNKQSHFLFYCEFELVGVVMNMIHICILLHCNVQDANITSTHDWNTVFFFHAPVAAVVLTVLIFATYTSSKMFLNYAVCMFICSCFPVWSYCLYIIMFYEVLMIPDPYPQSLWKTTTARVFCLFICSF